MMSHKLLSKTNSFWVISLLVTLRVSVCSAKTYCGDDYCNSTKQHILCKYQSAQPAAGCIGYANIVTEDDKSAILQKINSRRNKVAAGELSSLPSAANMLKMLWSEELAVSAQRWADQCVQHSASDIKDTCLDSGNTSVGQNIATVYGEAPGLTAAALVDVWYMELLNLNATVIGIYRPSVEVRSTHYDYFTQLVWADSHRVGCGGVRFKVSGSGENRTVYRLVCNFAPGGNRVGEPVYEGGAPCSRCRSSCDDQHAALCQSDVSRNNATFSTQFSPMFMILQNFTRSKNLKQNVFDRMLSEEMFSINNDIHEKDMSYLPTFQPLPKLYVSTPTLVVKQNWLVEKANTTKPGTIMPDSRDAAAPRKEKSKNASVEINKDQDLTIEKINDHNKKDKILGPRSLSHYTRASQRRKETNLRESKLCTCMVTNPSTSCSHVCTGPPSKRHTPACTRKHSITDLQPKPPNLHPLDLDKNSSPVALTPIYPVQYFPNYYIHMSVPSDIYDYEVSTRKRKHKHRKKTKMPDYYITSDKYLYYDEVKTPVEHKDQVDYDEEYKEHINIYFDDDKKVKVPNKKKYSEAAKDKGLVDSLVKDLKKYFSEDVIRECYYSKKSASNVVTVKGNVFLLVIVQFIFQ